MAEDLLLEIGLEEVPARYVRGAIEQLKAKTEKWLADSRLGYGEVKAYATPRRLAVVVTALADRQEDASEDVKGPSLKIARAADGSWSGPALGFARSQGFDPSEFIIREVANVEYVYAVKRRAGVETASLLPAALAALVTSLTFPKSMRWGSYELRYVRPIRWLVALYGSEVVPFTIAGVTSGRATRGHRFIGSDSVAIGRPAEYAEKLRAEHVIADVAERERAITDGIARLAAEKGWHIAVKDDLLEEVLFLVETPTVLFGSFDPAFLRIPQEVLITSMREHQRYFPVLDREGKLLPFFVTVRSGDDRSLDVVARGNEKVLRARLSDAKFFYEEDAKLVIADALAKLETIVYHEELGTVADKVRRVRKAADRIARELRLEPDVLADVSRAADICKFDLVSQMVYEFPELQGIMGEDYARKLGEDEAVARAVGEHYAPRNAGDKPPASLVGAVVGIADKIDTIAGCFSIGIIPTGSQDPYALRRQAAGIVATLLAHGFDISLTELFRIALETHKGCYEERRAAGDKLKGQPRETGATSRDMEEFFALRLKNVLEGLGIRYDVIDAVLGAGSDDVKRTMLRARALQEAAVPAAGGGDLSQRFRPAVDAFNRVANLAAKADAKLVDANLFRHEAEGALYTAWQQAHGRFVGHSAAGEMADALAALAALAAPVSALFDAVMIMAEDEAVRRNRLALLKLLDDDIRQFALFARLKG